VAVSSRVQGLLRFAELGRFDAVQVIHQDPVFLEAAFFLLLLNVKLVLHQVQAGEDIFQLASHEFSGHAIFGNKANADPFESSGDDPPDVVQFHQIRQDGSFAFRKGLEEPFPPDPFLAQRNHPAGFDIFQTPNSARNYFIFFIRALLSNSTVAPSRIFLRKFFAFRDTILNSR
jgi:hypothetical protein